MLDVVECCASTRSPLRMAVRAPYEDRLTVKLVEAPSCLVNMLAEAPAV